MRSCKLRLLAFFLAIGVACKPQPTVAPEPKNPAILSASPIWSSVLDVIVADSAQVLLGAETIDMPRAPRNVRRWVSRPLAADSAAVVDLINRNQVSTRFSASAFEHRAVVVYDSAFQRRFAAQRKPADDFHAAMNRYDPKIRGHLRLTLPGMSPDGRVAFVYLQFSCGSLCGWDEGITLERAPRGEWVVVARRRYSVS